MTHCPPSELWHDIGRTWMLQLLDTIKREPRGFNETKDALGISSKVLAQRLETLEEHGLIKRTYYEDGVRERSETRLTDKGADFFGVLEQFREFTHKHYEQLPCTETECTKCPYLKK